MVFVPRVTPGIELQAQEFMFAVHSIKQEVSVAYFSWCLNH